MKRISKGFIALLLAVSLMSVPFQSVDAAVVKYKNCTELNKVYAGGVAKDAKVKNKGGKTKYKPHVSAEIYHAHTKMDRDKDGIACER